MPASLFLLQMPTDLHSQLGETTNCENESEFVVQAIDANSDIKWETTNCENVRAFSKQGQSADLSCLSRIHQRLLTQRQGR